MSDDIRLRRDYTPGGDMRDELWGKVTPNRVLILHALAFDEGCVRREVSVGFTAADLPLPNEFEVAARVEGEGNA